MGALSSNVTFPRFKFSGSVGANCTLHFTSSLAHLSASQSFIFDGCAPNYGLLNDECALCAEVGVCVVFVFAMFAFLAVRVQHASITYHMSLFFSFGTR